MLQTDQLARSLETLRYSLRHFKESEPGSVENEVFRNAVIKGFELSLETSAKLLRKRLADYVAQPGAVHSLPFKEVFRRAAGFGILAPDAVERWFEYRDNRNDTAHDYGERFAEETVRLLPAFLTDAESLLTTLQHEP